MKKKVGIIEALRFIGMLFIFLCHIEFIHYSNNIHIKAIAEYFTLGEVGVELFIVMSGFAITLGYFNRDFSYKTFIIRRIARLYPLYLLFLIAGIFYMSNYFLTSPILTFAKLCQHIFMLQTITPIPHSATAFNGAAWTVATLFICYLITPTIFRGLKHKTKFTITILFTYFICINIIAQFFKENFSDYLYTWFTYLSPFFRFSDFLIGVCFGILFINTKNLEKQLSKNVFSFIEILLTTTWVYFTFNQINIQLYGLICAGLLFVYSFQKGFISNFFKRDIWIKLGAMSYSFYLCHYLILLTTNNLLVEHNLLSDSYLISAAVCCFILAITIGYIVNRKIEPKLNNWFSLNILRISNKSSFN